MDQPLTAILIVLLYYAMLFMSMVAHEYAHAFTAYRAGDPTAYNAGRLTFNPIKHVDFIWTICMPVMSFVSGIPLICGPKPVPVNHYNFRSLTRDYRLVSIAGVGVNVMIILALSVTIRVLTQVYPHGHFLVTLFGMVLISNILLTVFNLIPIPPLDGSRVLRTFLPEEFCNFFDRMDRYGFLIIIIAINMGGFGKTLWIAIDFVWINLLQLDAGLLDKITNGYTLARKVLFELFS